jgi:hypothetical protein
MRRAILLVACSCLLASLGCKKDDESSGQDKDKAQPRRMVKPGEAPDASSKLKP